MGALTRLGSSALQATDAPLPAIAVAGTGSIGVGFAVTFSMHGFQVRCWDPLPASLQRARADLAQRLSLLYAHGALEDTPDEVAARVSFHEALADATAGVALVQECAPEEVELKRSLFSALADVTGEDAVLASSSSALVPAAYAQGQRAARRILGAHPGNPPYLLPLVELIASEATSAACLVRATGLYEAAGLRVIRVGAQVEGFVFNRLQGALLREAYCLLRDGIATVDEIDAVVRLGLGRRWAFMGPFETIDLNTRGGIAAHAQRMGPAYERMGKERGQHDPWTPELVARATEQRRQLLPLEAWDDRVRWRDERLLELVAALED